MNRPAFDFITPLRTLTEHRVRFVVIGGVAGRLLGSPLITFDLDICYARDPENLKRLAAALADLDAHLRGRGVPADLPFPVDARTLAAGDHFTFETRLGPLDILGSPAGALGGFEQLQRAAVEFDLGGFRVLVASIDDLIQMKRAAGRPKDLAAVEELGAVRDLLDERAAEERGRRRQGRGPESDSTGGSSGAGPSGG